MYPFKYKKIMTLRVVAAIIIGAWLIAIPPAAWSIIFNVDGIMEVPQFGAGNVSIEAIFLFVLLSFVAAILTVVLTVYFAMKFYQVDRQIKRETGLAGPSGEFERITSLKKKQRNVKHMKKSIITVLVIVFGSAVIPILMTLLHVGGRFFIESHVYQDIIDYIIAVNIGYIMRFFHPLAYRLYFKQVREPMRRFWRKIVKMNKVNSVAPQS